MKQLFVVESPFQLLNAYEALKSFYARKQVLFVRFSGEYVNDEQIKDTLIKLGFYKIARIRCILINVKRRGVLDIVKLLFLKVLYFLISSSYKRIFIGNYESNFMRFIIPFNRKIILLDDGFKTITIQKKFTSQKYFDWFSVFDLDLIENQVLYKNNYNHLNLDYRIILKQDSNTILFIGSKLSEVGVINEKYYLLLINKISKRYFDSDIVYVAHRGESNEKLKQIDEIQNIKVIRLDCPIELISLDGRINPKIIASFYSTALITLNKIFRVETVAFKFNYSNYINKEDIDFVYQYCMKYIKVIEEINI